MKGLEGGQWSKDIRSAKNGRWTFVDRVSELKLGDKVYFWTYVDYNDGERTLGYRQDAGQWTVTGFKLHI